MTPSDYQQYRSFITSETASQDIIFAQKKFIDITGDLVTGILLSKIVYWFLPDKDGNLKVRVKKNGQLWIVKKRDEWYDEIRITPSQYDRAVKVLESQELIHTEVHKFDGNPTTHLTLNINILVEKLEAFIKTIPLNIEIESDDEPPNQGLRRRKPDINKTSNSLLRKHEEPITQNTTTETSESSSYLDTSYPSNLKSSEENAALPLASAKTKSIAVNKKPHACPKNLAPFVEYWESRGLTKHNRASATFKDAVDKLRKLTTGKLFNGIADLKDFADRPFNLMDFETAVDNYCLALTSENYLPKNKCSIKRSLATFLYTPHATSSWGLSLFLTYLTEAPRTNGVLPKYTGKQAEMYSKALQRLYREKVLGNIKGVYTHAQECQFIEAGNGLCKMIEENGNRLSQSISQTPFNIATMFMNCLLSDDYLVKRGISTGLLASPYSIYTRFPTYLLEQGMIVVGQTFNVNAVR